MPSSLLLQKFDILLIIKEKLMGIHLKKKKIEFYNQNHSNSQYERLHLTSNARFKYSTLRGYFKRQS